MADDVLCVRISPDGKMLAVALLDATIKVGALVGRRQRA
jgi:U3 small nucleolar RNA-associated protein 12